MIHMKMVCIPCIFLSSYTTNCHQVNKANLWQWVMVPGFSSHTMRHLSLLIRVKTLTEAFVFQMSTDIMYFCVWQTELKMHRLLIKLMKFRCDIMPTYMINDSKVHLFAKWISHKCLVWKEKGGYIYIERIETLIILTSIALICFHSYRINMFSF